MLLPIPLSLPSSLQETSSEYFSPLAQPSPKWGALYLAAASCPTPRHRNMILVLWAPFKGAGASFPHTLQQVMPQDT